MSNRPELSSWWCIPVLALLCSCGTESEHPTLQLLESVCSESPAVSYRMDDIQQLPVTRYVSIQQDSTPAGQGIEWGRIADVALHSDGTVYVADAMRKQVLALDGGRSEVDTLGRAGQGPGEFEYPIVVDIVHDSVLVFDPKLWRVTASGLDGTGASVVSPPSEAQIGQVWEGTFSTNGRLYHLSFEGYQASLMEELHGRREGVVRGEVQIRSWDRSGNQWQTLLKVPGPQVFANVDEGSILDVPFAKKPLWALDDTNTLWYADNSRYALLQVSPKGDRSCAGAVELEPPKVSTEDAERYRAAVDVQDPQDRRQVRQTRRGIPVPTTKPTLEAMVGGDDGSVWIRPAHQLWTQRRDGFVEWHVWSREDGVTTIALLPDDVEPIAIRQDRVLGIKTDILGVQTPVLLQPF